EIERMPLKRPPLSEAEIDTLRRWIDAGAAAPENEAPSAAPATHWAFVPPTRPEVPAVKDASWPRNPIDAFLLAALEREGPHPPPASARPPSPGRAGVAWLGPPPPPEKAEAFDPAPRPAPSERRTPRLPSSPHYGERWARPWLDLARYADSNGYSIDAPRQIW